MCWTLAGPLKIEETKQSVCRMQGTERFYAKHYEACTQLFSASMQYCGNAAQRAKGARLLALCSLACNDPTRCTKAAQGMCNR
jgi:hypothetical protein